MLKIEIMQVLIIIVRSFKIFVEKHGKKKSLGEKIQSLVPTFDLIWHFGLC